MQQQASGVVVGSSCCRILGRSLWAVLVMLLLVAVVMFVIVSLVLLLSRSIFSDLYSCISYRTELQLVRDMPSPTTSEHQLGIYIKTIFFWATKFDRSGEKASTNGRVNECMLLIFTQPPLPFVLRTTVSLTGGLYPADQKKSNAPAASAAWPNIYHTNREQPTRFLAPQN